MKLASSVAFALFLASADAFGQHSPVNGAAFGLSSSSGRKGDMSMRIGTSDMGRLQKFNNVLKEYGSSHTKEAVETTLLSPDTESLIIKSNWKTQKAMMRKIRKEAFKFDVEIDPSFGVSPTQVEREAAEKVAAAERKIVKAEKFAAAAAEAAELKAAKEARIAKAVAKAAAAKAAKIAKAPKKETAKATEAAPAPAAEAAPAPAAEAAPAPAAGGAVTPKTIKELRDATGAGMMDCKAALLECNGDQDAAAEFLRAKGLAKADKKAARVAAEGKIAISSAGNKAVLVEVNCETDFVGKDSTFLAYCDKVAGAAININDDSVETLMSQEVDGETLEATRQALVAKIGENIQVRRLASRGGEGSTIGAYVHMNRIGVLVELEGGDEALAQDIAMHVAAMNPPYARVEDVPGDVVEKEKKFLTEQALESGKPPEIVGKMVEGRIRKYLEEIVLISQNFVKDGDKTVGQLLDQKGAKMVGFTRLVVGEGIEKKKDDFAAEVAAMAGGKA